MHITRSQKSAQNNYTHTVNYGLEKDKSMQNMAINSKMDQGGHPQKRTRTINESGHGKGTLHTTYMYTFLFKIPDL